MQGESELAGCAPGRGSGCWGGSDGCKADHCRCTSSLSICWKQAAEIELHKIERQEQVDRSVS